MKFKDIRFIIQLIVSIGFLALILFGFNWTEFWSILGKLPFWFFGFLLLLICLGQALYALRWGIILREMGFNIPWWSLFKYNLVGIFFSNMLPTSVGGDAAKIYYLGKKFGFVNMSASVFMDRFLGLLWMVVMATFLSFHYNSCDLFYEMLQGVLLILLCAFILIIFTALYLPIHKIIDWLKNKFPRINIWLERLEIFLVHVHQIQKRPLIILLSLIIIFVYNVFFVIIYKMYFKFALQIDIPILALLLIISSIAILSNIPVSINGIGLREQLHFLLFSFWGVSKEAAVSVSLLIFSQTLLLSVIGYGIWIRINKGKSLKSE